MSCRILQNNHLYRRIEHKNIFKTFCKTYNRRSLSRQQQNRSKLNNTLEETSKMSTLTMDNITQSKLQMTRYDKAALNSERYELETSIPLNLHQKYSTKLLPAAFETHSKTTPVEFEVQSIYREKRFNRECLTSLSTKNHNSEVILLKWNEKRKKEEFKLKSCFQKDRANYEAPIDETDFSTLELKKHSEILSKRDDRYNQRWRTGMLRENNKDLASQIQSGFGSTKRGAFILSKYSKFLQEGMKRNKEQLSKTNK